MNCSKYHWWGNDDDWKECIENYAKDVKQILSNNTKILKNETREEFLLNIDNINVTPEGNDRDSTYMSLFRISC